MTDLSGIAFVRLDDDARVASRTRLAHQYLDRTPGTLVGQTAIEAFIDRRIDDVARLAPERGFASTEVTLRAADGPTYVVRARAVRATAAPGS